MVELLIGYNHCVVVRWLGTFATALEAAQAYDTAARKIPGAAKRCNFPEGDQGPVSPGVVTAKHPGKGLYEESFACCVRRYPGRWAAMQFGATERKHLRWLGHYQCCALQRTCCLWLEPSYIQLELPVAVCPCLSLLLPWDAFARAGSTLR